MELGQIRRELVGRHPLVSLDRIDQMLIDRHQEILDGLNWKRQEQQYAFNTVAEYNTGTITAGLNAQAIQGDGTTWDSTMDGRLIRIAAQSDCYSFTFQTTDSGQLDRGYAEADDSELTYRINQNIYALDSNVRILKSVRLSDGPLQKLTREQANDMYPGRNSYGIPCFYSEVMDSAAPVMQIELLPIPTEVHSIYLEVVQDADGLESGVTASATLPFERPGCLIAGVEADLLKLEKDYAGYSIEETRFGKLLNDMKRIECGRMGPVRLQKAPRHNASRYSYHPYYRR